MERTKANLEEIDSLLQWIEGVGDKNQGGPSHVEAQQIVLRCKTLVDRLVPQGHAYRKQSDDIFKKCDSATEYHHRSDYLLHEYMAALVKTLRHDLEDGRLDAVHEAIRVETCSDVLDVAAQYAADKELIAATVLAGGALETHLRHLCTKLGLRWKGDGSISKYNDTVAVARNEGKPIPYAKAVGGQVTAWGQLRNDAAHDPATFQTKHSTVEVNSMVSGVRDFIVRHP